MVLGIVDNVQPFYLIDRQLHTLYNTSRYPVILLMGNAAHTSFVQINWYTDFYYPFLARWVERVRSVPGARNKIVFVEAIPNEVCRCAFSRHNVLAH